MKGRDSTGAGDSAHRRPPGTGVPDAPGHGQGPDARGGPDDSARLVSEDGNTLVVEFRTRTGGRTVTTLEEVTFFPPERITFRHLKGPLSSVWEEFSLQEDGESTMTVHYRGEFSIDIPVVGWLIGRLYVKRLFGRVVREHMERIKEMAEKRAARSHVFRRSSPEASQEAGR